MRLKEFLQINEDKDDAVTDELIKLAANCGINAKGMTVGELKAAHDQQKHPQFSDQHDARLEAALKKYL